MSEIRQIWKFKLMIEDSQVIEMPAFADVKCVQLQGASLCLWAQVDPTKPMKPRRFTIHGTGHDIGGWDSKCYIGTVQQGPLVWHIFEWFPQIIP